MERRSRGRMRTTALVLASALLILGIASLPAAEARGLCTYGSGDPCDDYVVCVWNYAQGGWICEGYVDPCWFRCWYP